MRKVRKVRDCSTGGGTAVNPSLPLFEDAEPPLAGHATDDIALDGAREVDCMSRPPSSLRPAAPAPGTGWSVEVAHPGFLGSGGAG